MASCPDHARELVTGADGRACPFCRGRFVTPSQLNDIDPEVTQVLAPETRADALPFKKRRACPDCATTMAPLRLGRLEAWIEQCPQCEGAWVEPADVKSIALIVSGQRRHDAWSSMDASERQAIARDLAESELPKSELPVEDLSAGQVAQAVVGVPVLTQLDGDQRPIVTLACTAILACIALGGFLAPDNFGFEALAYDPRTGSFFDALIAVFAHDGWLHAIGNGLFLWVFGDAVERRAPRWVVPAALLGVGSLSLMIDGAFATGHTLIGGASGGVFTLLGMTAVLQRRARWLVPLTTMLPFLAFRRGLNPFIALRVPLPVAMVFYVAFDTIVASSDRSGIAWLSHASGFGLGLVAGFVIDRLDQRA